MDIVIVDADEGIESYYKAILEAEFRGLSVKFFAHSQPALDYTKDHTCDLVITDTVLPDSDIFTFIDKLSENKCPVIVVSSDTSERLVVECLRSGALDFLSKREIKLGIFPRIMARAFLEADRWARLQEISRSLPHRPEYFKVNDEVRSFLVHEKEEKVRSLLSRGIVSEDQELLDGQSYFIIYLYLQLQVPQALGIAADPERLNRIRNNLLARAAAITERYGGREWTRKNDGSFFGFVGKRFLPAVVAAMEVHSMVSVFNATSQNVVDRIGLNIGVAAGNTVYRANKGDIYSEALNLSAHMAMSNGLFHGVMITQDILDNLTPRARKYFFRSEKFEQQAVYHYEVIS